MSRTTPRVAVVTGAAREGGIGRAIAARLLRDGCRVMISDLGQPMESHPEYQASGGAELAQAVAALEPLGDVVSFPCDVRNAIQVEELLDRTVDVFGSIDVMVNNAGIAVGLAPVVEIADADWQVNLEVMATGVFLCSRGAARRMIDQGRGGRIITIASQAGKVGMARMGAYCAAKFAAVGLTQVMALELGEFNITVNAVCPGTVMTPLLGVKGGLFDTYTAMTGLSREEYEHRLKRTIPVRRFETPEDVAASVAFLASEDAAYITGEALNVNGGQLMD